MDIWDKLQLWRKWSRFQGAMKEGEKMGYDVNKSLKKGGIGLLQGAGAAILAALFAFMADPIAVGAALEGMDSPGMGAAAAGIIVALGKFANNWYKHRNKQAED